MNKGLYFDFQTHIWGNCVGAFRKCCVCRECRICHGAAVEQLTFSHRSSLDSLSYMNLWHKQDLGETEV